MHGSSTSWQGVYGYSQLNAGIVGESAQFHAVFGISHNVNNAGVFGTNDAGGFAAVFDGRVAVSGDCTLNQVWVNGDCNLVNADCAEEFTVVSSDPDTQAEPGTVMVLAEDGCVRYCDRAYDKCVAGVVSGAGSYRPAIVLDRRPGKGIRKPLALIGKVYCKVDAGSGPVEIGDLLTTSDTAGHAMKAADPLRAFGAVLGKALQPLKHGCGMIPILVALQ